MTAFRDAIANMRILTITAAEWASVRDGRLWLVREGWWEYTAACEGVAATEWRNPPVEFVQTCAPCMWCAESREWFMPDTEQYEPCQGCRIELVGSCAWSALGGACADHVITLGHAYAVGQPLPIIHVSQSGYPSIYVFSGGTYIDRGGWDVAESADLAHYGPPETLVGKWALELAVVS